MIALEFLFWVGVAAYVIWRLRHIIRSASQ